MSTSSALQAMYAPGRLSVALSNQTYDFSTVYPHGGTALGLVRDVQIRRTEGRELIVAEEFGQEVIDELYLAESWSMAFALRGMDQDALSAIFPNPATGSVSKQKGVVYPGTTIAPGMLKAGSAIKMLFTPNDTTNHHAVYFPNAVPEVSEALAIDFVRSAEVMVACAFRAIRDGSTAGRMCQVLLLEDLTL